MIGSSRFLTLLFAIVGSACAMSFIRKNYEGHRESDWPATFPDSPDGFYFGCRRCRCQCAQNPTTKKSSTTAAPTSSSTVAPTTTKTVKTTATTTVVPSTSTVPATSPSTSARPTTTQVPSSSSTKSATTNANADMDVPQMFGAPFTVLPESDIPGNDRVVADEVDAGTTVTETGTTFWIRTPTPANAPDSVYPGSGGVPVFATVAFNSPFAPDAALAPLDGGEAQDDLDFGIRTVGTPKAPRAPIDPDA
ncbi:unnamed protein product [Caenorhabditis sp. 36 PRJEB53466]|nr:unnamed protein product [Caenorhabditis sp. 36 PRJEB53466]